MRRPARSTFDTALPVDLPATLGGLRYGGRWDPCLRASPAGVWRATRYPSGPATVQLSAVKADRVRVTAWGPGAEEAVEAAPDLVGARDDDGGLTSSDDGLVRRLAREHPGLRWGRTGNPIEVLVPAIIHQKVPTRMAVRSFCAMVRAAGMPAPASEVAGAPRLLLPPTPAWLARQPSWAWHQWGIEQKRAAAVVTVAACAGRINEAVGMDQASAEARVCSLPGVGPWTWAQVAATALGDPDAVLVGDFWLCHIVCHALEGRARGTDERMLELLEPWRGQRGRVCRLLRAGGPKLPRFGPRLPLYDIRPL